MNLSIGDHLGLISRLSPLLRMFRWLCHSLCSLWIVRLKQIIRRMLGTLKPRIGHAGQRLEGEGRTLVTGGLWLPTMCSLLLLQGRWTGGGLQLWELDGATFSAFWLWEGTLRTGHKPNTLPSCTWLGGEWVCGDDRIWGSCTLQAVFLLVGPPVSPPAFQIYRKHS
jgi:hypothetical protein